jgi:16S rRNA (guanine527-N7)-methyltransferase
VAETSNEEFTDRDLESAIRQSTPELSDAQVASLIGYRDLMFETNQRINLTAVRDRSEMGRRLVLESLRLVRPLRGAIGLDRDPRVLDLGTGGGIPGVLLAIAFPDVQFALLDATGKKLAAVNEMVMALGLANVETVHVRAEEAAHDEAWRGTFTVVTARAVSSLPALVELGLPFLKLHGHLLLPKGMEIDDELRAAEKAARIVGGRIASSVVLPDNGSHVETTLVVIEKNRTTPAAYPRRTGLPTRQPLGAGS